MGLKQVGYKGKPLSSRSLSRALGELTPFGGLLELECDTLSDDELFSLLVAQVKKKEKKGGF